uniref:Zgc:193711 n=1 Tax=Sinocyclocheilus rhinocerous TaxID=307959 RepID=A0A673LJ70_9TELE
NTVKCSSFSQRISLTNKPNLYLNCMFARVDAHVYGLVSAEPQYAQVNKKRKQNEDGLHYAEIQVLQSENATSRGKLKQTPNYDNTEYATLDFATL